MKRTWRWTRRLVLGVAALVVLALGGGLIFIHTDAGRDVVRRRVEAALLGSFPGGAHIGHLDGSVFGTLVIDDLRLNGRDGKPMLVIGTARVKLALLPLLGHVARIDSVVLDDVRLDIHPQPERPAEPPEPAGEGGATWTVEIPQVMVQRGRVTIASATRTIELADLEAQASVSVAEVLTVAVHATGSSAGKRVEATALLAYTGSTLVAPLVVAQVGHANLFGLGVSTGSRVDGVIRANLPAALAYELTGVTLPGDAEVAITAQHGAVDAQLAMAGASVRALLDADLDTRSVKGLVIAEVPDATRLEPLIDHRVGGGGIVTASLDASLDPVHGHVRGLVTLDGVYLLDKAMVGQDQVRGKTLVAVDASLAHAWLYLDGGTDLGGARVTAIAEVAKQQETYVLEKSTLVAAAGRVGARRTDLAVGSVTANLRAAGPLWPAPHLEVTGVVGGDSLRYGALSAQTVDLSFVVDKQASGHLDLGKVRRGNLLLGSAGLDAHGTLVRSDAGNVITVEIDRHSVTTAANGTWAGSGGRVVIGPDTITVANLHTGNGDGTVVADVAYTKASQDLHAKLDAKRVALATLAPGLGGTLAATVDLRRRGGRWSGSGHVAAAKLAVPDRPVVDVDANVRVAGRRIELETTATADAGTVSLAADLTGPYDPIDVRAWKRLERRAITSLSIGATKLDLAKLGVPDLDRRGRRQARRHGERRERRPPRLGRGQRGRNVRR